MIKNQPAPNFGPPQYPSQLLSLAQNVNQSFCDTNHLMETAVKNGTSFCYCTINPLRFENLATSLVVSIAQPCSRKDSLFLFVLLFFCFSELVFPGLNIKQNKLLVGEAYLAEGGLENHFPLSFYQNWYFVSKIVLT